MTHRWKQYQPALFCGDEKKRAAFWKAATRNHYTIPIVLRYTCSHMQHVHIQIPYLLHDLVQAYPGIFKDTLFSSSGFKEIPIHCIECKHRPSMACQGNRWRYNLLHKTTLANQKAEKQQRPAKKPCFFCLHINTKNGVLEYLHPDRSFPKAQISMTWNVVFVGTKGQDAKKRLCFKKYLCVYRAQGAFNVSQKKFAGYTWDIIYHSDHIFKARTPW